MSTYLSGALTLVLLAALLGFSIEVAGIYHTTRSVDAAILFAEMEMGLQGCVSDRAVSILRERIRREGLDPDRLTLTASALPGQPRAFWGDRVDLLVRYDEHLAVPRPFDLRIERRVSTISGWVGSRNDDLCP